MKVIKGFLAQMIMKGKPKINDCENCGWGVRWLHVGGLIVGTCQWQSSLTKEQDMAKEPSCMRKITPYFVASNPKRNCAAWKPQVEGNIYQKWREPPEDFINRMLEILNK